MLELRALGGLRLEGAEAVQPKRLALLCYLALAQPHALHRRDRLVALFWPELDTAHARQALRQALTSIRALDEHVLVSRGDEEVGIAASSLASDVLAFEDALKRGDLVTALQLYKGPLLDAFFLSDCPEFERWAEMERARLARLAGDAAWALADQERLRAPAAGVQWAHRAAAFQPEDEGALRRLVSFLDSVGERAGALREYEAFARRLLEEYRAEPAPETQALIAAVKDRRQPRVPVSIAQHTDAGEGARVTGSLVPARRHPGLTHPRAWIYAFGIVLLAAVLWGLATLRAAAGRRDGPVRSIAVLPLVDLSLANREPYFAYGMTEAVINELGRAGEFDKVISLMSVRPYEDVTEPTAVIARQLGVDAVVRGSFARSDGRLRVTTQLIHGRTERVLWAESFERDLRDVLGLQRDLGRAIAQAVQARLRVPGADTAGRRAVNPLAHDAYLRGIYHINRRGGNIGRALDELRRAVQLDSLFPSAYARLAEAYALAGYSGYPGAPQPMEAFAVANAALARALALDSSLADVQVTLAQLRWMYDPNIPEAERAARRAVALNPSLADAQRELGRIHAMLSRHDSAIAAIERARDLDPLNPVRHADVAWAYWVARRYDDAIRLAQQAIAMDSGALLSYLALGGAYDATGRHADAAAALESGFARGNERLFLPFLGYAYARGGRSAGARRILAQLRELNRAGLVSPYYVAQLYLGLGRRDSALTWLETAYQEPWGHVVWLDGGYQWGPLRGDPRFEALRAKVGLTSPPL